MITIINDAGRELKLHEADTLNLVDLLAEGGKSFTAAAKQSAEEIRTDVKNESKQFTWADQADIADLADDLKGFIQQGPNVRPAPKDI